MHGYAVSARIEKAPVRARHTLVPPIAATPAVDTADGAERLARVSTSETPGPGPFEQFLSYLRPQWEQRTFCLFDPQSWRCSSRSPVDRACG
jgi:hypothetical protein